MKVNVKWLKAYVPIAVSPEQLAHKMTMAGLEVEKIHSLRNDAVFELEITPNRPDCLNVVGLAREVAAIFNKNLRPPVIKKASLPKAKTDITILDKEGCPRYIGALIKNIRVAASPADIQTKIKAIGMNPINNVVDITNFCLMELGQPLHAFDYDKLEGGKIIVRRARKGEKIAAIDDKEYELDPSILVIADSKRPVAIAGVMGGKATEVTAATKNILLESAYFDPILIRRAARRLGLASDSSYRFERGVDFQGVHGGAQRAIALILQHAKGRLKAYQDRIVLKKKDTQISLSVSVPEINTLLGTTITAGQCKTILTKLGFKVSAGKSGAMKVTPPSFRTDIKEAVDIIEEIARVIGFDQLPVTFPRIRPAQIPENFKRHDRRLLADVLLAQGCHEAITYTMTNQRNLMKTNLPAAQALKVKNPLTQDQELMCPSLLPNLLAAVATNINRGQKDVRLFEIGKTYTKAKEKETLGIILTGLSRDDWREAKQRLADFYDLKGILETAFEKLRIKHPNFISQEHPMFAAGQSVSLKQGAKIIGLAGKIADKVLVQWDIKKGDIFFAEIDLEFLHEDNKAAKRYKPVSLFPAVVRDISLAVKETVAFQQIREVIEETKPEFLLAIKFLEEYIGDKIPPGQRGISFSMVFQSSKRTLREDEVNKAHDRICQALGERLGAVRR